MNHQPFTGDERLQSESQRFSHSDFYDIQLGGSEHLTADDFCLFGRAGRQCGCGFCREMVARERDSENRI